MWYYENDDGKIYKNVQNFLFEFYVRKKKTAKKVINF